MKKLDPKTISQIEHALSVVEFGEVILIIHERVLVGIDVKDRKRLVDKDNIMV